MRIITLLLIILIAFPSFAKKPKEKTAKVLIAKKEMIYDQFIYPTRVESQVQSALLSETQGTVTKIHVELGDRVKKNQPLIEIKSLDPGYHFKAAKILSPISGVVAKQMVNVGENVTKGQKLLSVIDSSKIQMKIEIPTNEVSYLKKGQLGFFTSKDSKNQQKIMITGLSPYADSATGTHTVLITPENTKTFKAPLGSLGEIQFQTNEREGILFPIDSIGYQGKQAYLRKVKQDNTVQRIDISLGASRFGKAEILSGVEAGDVLVTSSNSYLEDGVKITIEDDPRKKKTEKKEPEAKK